ncbi:MAG: polyprenyl synthetase family protein [Bacteroidales bacterium]|jgi:octaprenyl-diphosphate synthase|nr:polyprenyl synthetase family protein [Bacteroidales bacterium]
MLKDIKIIKTINPDLQRFESSLDEIIKLYDYFPDKILQYILETKGKKIRPSLTYLSAHLFGKPTISTDTAALIIELMHIASLLHDDVIDEAKLRRKQLTVNSKWDNKTAILTGDFIFSLAMKIAAQTKEYYLFDLISPAVMDLSLGEIYEIKFSNYFEINKEKYFQIIRLKTAALIACCFECGAYSVKAEKNEIETAKKLGEIIGIMFQIKDDMLDYIGKKTGKEIGIDIKDKKITLPLILAYHNMDEKSKKEIENLWENVDERNFQRIISLVVENKGIEKSEEILFQYRSESKQLLEKFSNKKIISTIKKLIEYLTVRDK